MANQKGMAVQQTIVTLYKRGRSIRHIAMELGISRNTVRTYVRGIQTDPPPIPGSQAQTDPPPIPGSQAQIDPPGQEASAVLLSGSLCSPFQAFIEASLQQGLCGQRIFQDLVDAYEFTGSYSSVRRFIRRLGRISALPFRRMECAPGEEAQIDFGQGTWIVDESGKRRRPWLFRVVLSHSRKGYSEVVWRQTTENFIRALENSFLHFGGVPEKLVPDNLKAVVTRCDWHDPDIHSKISAFCEHYGTVMLPTKPRTPRHKGKVERAIDYAQENALKGRTFKSLHEQNKHLRNWEERVADTRIHGTTRQQVREAFELEKEHLQALPPMLFPCYEEGKRKVHTDGHVSVGSSYYSVPPEFVRREVHVRWDGRIVRIFDQAGTTLLRTHARTEPGRFSTNEADISHRKINALERGEHFLLKRAELIGPDVMEWGTKMLKARGTPGIRVLQGLVNLGGKYPLESLQQGCRRAIDLDVYRLKELKKLIKAVDVYEQLELPFCQEGAMIRELSEYAVDVNFQQEQNRKETIA